MKMNGLNMYLFEFFHLFIAIIYLTIVFMKFIF